MTDNEYVTTLCTILGCQDRLTEDFLRRPVITTLTRGAYGVISSAVIEIQGTPVRLPVFVTPADSFRTSETILSVNGISPVRGSKRQRALLNLLNGYLTPIVQEARRVEQPS